MFFLIVLLIILFVVIVLLPKLVGHQNTMGTFKLKTYLLSKTELNFYKALLMYLPQNRSVMAKVGLKDIIESNSNDRRQKNSDWGKIKSKHVDFVIIDSLTSQIISCVELDDSSHASNAAKKRDDVKNESLRLAGVKLTRIKATASYTKEQILNIYE